MNQFIRTVVITTLWVWALLQHFVVFTANSHGGKVIIDVNSYGEGVFETYVLFPVVLILGLFVLFEEFTNLKEEAETFGQTKNL